MWSSLSYASTFRREPGNAPELRLQLRPLPPRIEADQEITLEIGPRQAEVSVRMDLRAPADDLSLIEWEIQSDRPFVVAGVLGTDVGRWCQSGSRVLVWLRKTTGATRLELTGWLPLAQPGDKGQKPAGPPRLDLPCFRVLQAQTRTRLVLRPTPGLTLIPQANPPPRFLTPEAGAAVGELRYVARQSGYGGSFAVLPGLAPTVEVQTRAGVRGKEMTFTATIDYRPRGELRMVSLLSRDWQGEVDLEAPAGSVARRREQFRRSAGRRERTWNLELAPGIRDRYQVVLHGRMPVEEAIEGVPMPDVVVVGAPAQRIVVVDSTVTAQAGVGLSATVPPLGSSARTRAWKLADEEWALWLQPREGPRAAAVQVLLAERRASVPDGRSWLHETVFWLRHEAPAELRLRWPAGVEVVGVTVDDSPLSVVQSERGGLWLPLSGPAGARQVRVRWRSEDGRETLEHPDLRLPLLEGADPGPTVWTLNVPPNWDVAEGGPGLGAGASRRAALELYRASAQLALCRDLVRQQRVEEQALAEAQRRFARGCWLAELALKAGADALRRVSPVGLPLTEWLRQLRDQNQTLCQEHHLDEARRKPSAFAIRPTPMRRRRHCAAKARP